MKLTDLTDYSGYVGLLSEGQTQLLLGQQYADDSYFNPIKDSSGNWIISVEEMQGCTVTQFSWVADLDVIPYSPIVRQVNPLS